MQHIFSPSWSQIEKNVGMLCHLMKSLELLPGENEIDRQSGATQEEEKHTGREMAWTQAHLVNPINLQCAPPASHLLDILIKIKAESKIGQERIWRSTGLRVWALNSALKTDAGHCRFSYYLPLYASAHWGVCYRSSDRQESHLPHGICGPAATSILCSIFNQRFKRENKFPYR